MKFGNLVEIFPWPHLPVKGLINRPQFFKVYTLIDHSNDIKMFKTQVEPRAVSFEHFDVISTVKKNRDHGKLRSILVFYNNIDS